MKYQFPFPEVEGLLSENDKEALRALSAKCRHLPGVYVEIGSYKGLSALCIAEGFDRVRTLFCYDFFEPEKLAEFIKNTEAGEIVVAPVEGDFKKTFALNTVCFAFVDHSHTFDDTKAAWELLWPRVVKGGLLIFYDYGHSLYPEATEFLDGLEIASDAPEGMGFVVFKK